MSHIPATYPGNGRLGATNRLLSWLLQRPQLPLAVSDFGSHAAFLASYFPTPFTRLLRPHWLNSIDVKQICFEPHTLLAIGKTAQYSNPIAI